MVIKTFKILFPLVILGLVSHQLYFLFIKEIPCKESIPFRLGTFDKRFNISEDYFLEALKDAEAIWEGPYGKNLFDYVPSDTVQNVLKINLIYDYRQEATSKLASLGIVVLNNKASYNDLQTKFNVRKATYSQHKTILDAKIEAVDQRIKAYENDVNFWNKKGGAPQKEYEKLEATRLLLDKEVKEINTEQVRLKNMVDEINALIVVLNRLASSLNLTVEKYNTTNVARGESFEEGVYTSDGRSREIDIYEFSSRDKLLRVLAHELGHALNIEHVPDSSAIMYEFNQGDNMELSKADLGALKIICGTE